MRKIVRLLEEHRARLREQFMELAELARTFGVPMETHFLEGAPSQVIPERVVQLNIDLLVMGTIARSGVSGFFIGNTAEQILEQVQCPLLAVKPDGFRCPIPAGRPTHG